MKFNQNFPSTWFTWIGTRGVAEISSLGTVSMERPIKVQSSKTGQVEFFYPGNVATLDGELWYWSFATMDNKYSLTIYND